jgi:hypothetical protein
MRGREPERPEEAEPTPPDQEEMPELDVIDPLKRDEEMPGLDPALPPVPPE